VEGFPHQEQGSTTTPDATSPKLTFANSAAQGIGAIADQGLFAISNFALNLILARRMATTEFGAFSAAFATFLLLATSYSAIVTEPMLVFALSSRDQWQKSYVKRVSALHWKAAPLVSLAVATVGIIRYAIHPQISSIIAYVGWALAAPVVLWLWFARRTAYITRTPHRAAIAGAGYLVCMTALLIAFGGIASKYPLLICVLFAVPSVIVAPLLRMTVPLKDVGQSPTGKDAKVWQAHWAYGKWASLGGLCGAIIAPIYFFVLPLDGCAAYRAIMNIPMPLLQTYTALGPAFIAMFTPLRGKSQFRNAVTKSLIGVSSAALGLALAASLCSKELLRILYSDKYTAYSAELWPLMVYSLLVSATVVLDSAMRSAGKVKTATAASVTAVFVSFSIGIPAAIAFGVRGAVYGLIASQFSTLCVLLVAYIRMKTSTTPARVVSSTSLSGLSESAMPRRIYNDA
jgi:O-antigen/teichoic acid export membrane protein